MIQAIILAGCTFGDEPGVCPYNLRLDYWYAGSGSENVLPVYVDNLRQYLFDGTGNLLGITTLRGDSIRSWQTNLPEGDYTVVLWGNCAENGSDNLSVLPPSGTELSGMRLSADAAVPEQYQPPLLWQLCFPCERRAVAPATGLPFARTCFAARHRTVDGRRATRRRYLPYANERASCRIRLRQRVGERPADWWRLLYRPLHQHLIAQS